MKKAVVYLSMHGCMYVLIDLRCVARYTMDLDINYLILPPLNFLRTSSNTS